ncbi:MAG TPA: aldehyde dehydrogenase family protein [Rhizomicrobium sp.]
MEFFADYTMTTGGAAVSAPSTFDVVNPANAQVFAAAPDCSPEQLDLAVQAARDAFPAWAAVPLDERRDRVRGLARAIMEAAEPLKRLLTMEQGKPHADAEGEVMGAGLMMQAYTGLDLPTAVAEDTAEHRVETHRVPLGVVAAIVPWNYPLILAAFKLGPALLAGNTVVLKPSPYTPLSTLKIGELARSILPPGVLNVVSGGDALGPWMTAHPGIDKVSFTGSAATGKRVMAGAAGTLKRMTLELGGNDAAIVLPDIDIETVAPQLFWSAFANNGQICIATKRLYVHEDIYEPLAAAIARYARTVKVGDGALQGTQIGPINNRAQFDRVRDLIADARDNGFKFLLDGRSPDGPGYFVPITLIDDPPEDSRIVQEEQFGPVLPLLRFRDVDDVVARANRGENGLAGSVWSADTEKATAIARRLATGTVFINKVQYLSPLAPFGGHKQSGFGVENGVEGLLGYTNAQTFVTAK